MVADVTGIRQRETVPDWLVDLADQVELVDMSPHALSAGCCTATSTPTTESRARPAALLHDGEPHRATRAGADARGEPGRRLAPRRWSGARPRRRGSECSCASRGRNSPRNWYGAAPGSRDAHRASSSSCMSAEEGGKKKIEGTWIEDIQKLTGRPRRFLRGRARARSPSTRCWRSPTNSSSRRSSWEHQMTLGGGS